MYKYIFYVSFMFPYHSILFGTWSFQDKKLKIISNSNHLKPCKTRTLQRFPGRVCRAWNTKKKYPTKCQRDIFM